MINLAFINTAMAAQSAGASQAATSSTMSSVLLLVGFMLIFYFMLWRPQSKKAKEHQLLIANLKKDDEIITNGGVLGRIIRVTDQFVIVAIAEEVEITVQKQSISAVVPKGTLKSV